MIDLINIPSILHKSIYDIADDCGIGATLVSRATLWDIYPTVSFNTIVVLLAYYKLTVEQAFRWIPDKGAQMKYVKWKKKMAGRWDRYRRQRILEELTDTKQNWSLSFKLDVINEYYSTDITMRELSEKHGVPKEKIKGWIFKNYQV